ncbi:MAG: isoprenylcysteine carboxylmethyltransferase family protein, partial [Vicinamibacterales bacterium]
MTPGVSIAVLTLLAVLLLMGGEAVLSRVNEAALRRRGAVEPPGDVYRLMQWVYPACFVAMAVEGALRGPSPATVLLAGLVVFGLAKGLKLWAITSLGERWSFRVLVLPEAPLVAGGPYRWVNHPNYLAVLGELIGIALTVAAPVTGLAAV